MKRTKDEFTREWIIRNSEEIVSEYADGILTIRGLHYRLVSRGMTNTVQHYKRVVSAMEKARWDGIIRFETFSDHEREMIGETAAAEVLLANEIDKGQLQIKAWMENYSRNRWENQQYYPEVFIEKKALQGVFEEICTEYEVALGACKGYPSLTFLNEAKERFRDAYYVRGQRPIILYFGDYDPSGEDIPRSIHENLYKFGIGVDVKRIALLEHQVIEWDLPPAPTKEYKIGKRSNGSIGYIGDSRDKEWDGLGQVELDAVEPRKLQSLCAEAIENVFDHGKHEELKKQEEKERRDYIIALKSFVKNI